ncbi:MAG: hypothetical protein AB7F67_11910 [Rhodospirillaceae bacterium]
MRRAVLALALLAGGCSGIPIVHDGTNTSDTVAELGYAARGGELKTVVRGNPFAAPDSALVAAVMRAMFMSNRGRVVRFTPSPRAVSSLDYRVVMQFNGPAAGSELCAAGAVPPPPRPPSPSVRVDAAFCRDALALSEAWGTIDGPSGPEDAGFQQLVSDVTRALFPEPRRDDRRRDGFSLLR